MNSDTRTITIPHRKLCSFDLVLGLVWMNLCLWYSLLRNISLVLLGCHLPPGLGWFCLVLVLFWFALPSLPGLLLGYSQIVLVVREEEEEQEKMATIHVQHYRQWAYMLSGRFLTDMTVSIPLHSSREDDSSGQSILQLVVKQPSDQRKTWICYVFPRLSLDNDSGGGHQMSKKALGFTLSSELLGLDTQNIRFQRALYLTQVLNVWCDDAVRDKKSRVTMHMISTATAAPTSSALHPHMNLSWTSKWFRNNHDKNSRSIQQSNNNRSSLYH